VAIELIQMATLIHDDFVDQDTLRRNRPAAWTLEGARRAVLIGDVIFATAIEMMEDIGREDGLAVSHAIAQISKGALYEPLDPLGLTREMESNRLDNKWYEEIIHLKTAVLFGTACHLGAISAGADGNVKEISYRYGLRIGEAYQIADDLKELKQHRLKQLILPQQMAALAPALLYFASEVRPYLLIMLKEGRLELKDRALEFFDVAAELMEKEVERRLTSAVIEIEKDFPDNVYAQLVRKAPSGVIRMFNQS